MCQVKRGCLHCLFPPSTFSWTICFQGGIQIGTKDWWTRVAIAAWGDEGGDIMRKLSPEVPVHIKAWLFPLLARAADGRTGQTLDSVFLRLISRAPLPSWSQHRACLFFLGSSVGKSLKCKASPFISFWGILLENRERDDEILLVMSGDMIAPANRFSSPSMWHQFSPSTWKNRHTTVFDLCSSSALKHQLSLIFYYSTASFQQSLSNHHLFKWLPYTPVA